MLIIPHIATTRDVTGEMFADSSNISGYYKAKTCHKDKFLLYGGR